MANSWARCCKAWIARTCRGWLVLRAPEADDAMAFLSGAQYTVGRSLRWVGIVGGVGLLILFWGAAIAVAEVNAVLLFTSLIASLFILLDFRVGVVTLIVLMPFSHSTLFPHQMAGVTGLNPLNVLLVATFG